MKIDEENETEGEKIPRKLNTILIERIRKYGVQDTSQLVNGPNDEDTNNYYLGGLINFDGNNNDNSSNYEINPDMDNMTENDIYIEPYEYNDYNNELEEEEEEEEENEKDIKDIIINPKKNSQEKNLEKNKNKELNNKKENNNNNNAKNIRLILSENFNDYLDRIQKNYNRYSSNHYPQLILNNKNAINNNKYTIKSIKEKIYTTKTGEKIILNEDYYTTSLAYLKNKDLFYDIPSRYKKAKEEFTLDYNLLEEEMTNIQMKSLEFIELNSKVSTSISKVLLFSHHLEKYIKDKLDPFNNSINISYDKVIKDKKFITEIKLKTMKNAGNIILKRLKMNNSRKLIKTLKKYINIKNSMNSLELLFERKKNTQQIYDLINKCKEEINKIKEFNMKEKYKENIIELFEKKLEEFKNKNDTNMSGELSELLNRYFMTFLYFQDIIDNSDENIEKNNYFKDYEKYGITKFVIEKIISMSDKYNLILKTIYFSPNEDEKEKLSKIFDYYIEGNLINKIYIQLKGIFTSLCEQQLEYILSIFREKLINLNKANKEKEEKKEVNQEQNKINENNAISDEIFVLICIIFSKNKLKEIILSFIDVILKKIEKSEIIDKSLKNKIIKECQNIKLLLEDNIKNITKDQIQICLTKTSLNNDINIDIFITNYYLILEAIKDEIPNYIDQENKNTNKLSQIIIKEQKHFIENWTKNILSKFENNTYKTMSILKKIPQKYQSILNVYFSFDIDNNCMKDMSLITKYPKEKIDMINEALEEEEENNNNEENETNEELLNIKDGEKLEYKIKICQESLDIINFAFDILKMFTLFHKDCYPNILGNMAVIVISHLNLQTDKIYDTNNNSEIKPDEISMSYCIYILIQYIYEHIKDNDFFVVVAEYCKKSKQKLIDSYLEISKTINRGIENSKQKMEEILEIKCIKASLIKLQQIELPHYDIVPGDVPVKEYALLFVSSLKQIYDSMINCFEENFVNDMVNKALEDFFDKFEEFIFHGQKIVEENCLRQFKRDMIFLKKNLVFITIVDLTDVKTRIDNINKSVLPESMLKTKKK